MNSNIISIVTDKIKSKATLLNDVSQFLWKNPELKFEEHKAHDFLCKTLEEHGFNVTRNYILPTAFRAEYSGKRKDSKPCIAILCEYDALPEVGHACGHNLIAEAGIGAALGIKAAFDADATLPGKLVVLGTPAEEGGGGKIFLINGGAFKDIDAALMVHPSPDDYLYTPFIAVGRFKVTYTGKEAHASGYPWEGINALDAAVACYNSVSFLRQQLKPNHKVHGIITNGGKEPTVIPGKSALYFYYRAPTSKEMKELKEKLDACCKNAALATGCKVDIEQTEEEIDKSLITNKVLVELYSFYAEKLGNIKFEDRNHKVIPFVASSDMGNVSHTVPSIHPLYSIGTKATNHSREFNEAAGHIEAQFHTIVAAQTMALVSLETMMNSKILDKIKKQFVKDLHNIA